MRPQDLPLSAAHPFHQAFRHLLDVLIALILLLILSPLLLLVTLLVVCTSPGHPFYCQQRVGRGNRLFAICKFRTMRSNSDRHGPSVTSANDMRITPIGRFLRHSKLDELPQLWNVVRGDMSLVGPRPQVPRFVECFDPDLRHIVMRVRPGITGPAALRFRHEESLLAGKEDREGYYISDILPVKLNMDVEYVLNQSLRSDIKLLLETARLLSFKPVQRVFVLRRRQIVLRDGDPSLSSVTPKRAEAENLGKPQDDAFSAAHM